MLAAESLRISFIPQMDGPFTVEFRGVGNGESFRQRSRQTYALERNRTHAHQCKIGVYEIQIVFAFINSRMPAAPSSRPKPECLTPPNGRRGSDATIALMKTIPVSKSEAKSFCSSGSLVHALEPRPNVVSFASSIASCASRTRKMDATGPNTSSRYAGESFGTLTRTVGS